MLLTVFVIVDVVLTGAITVLTHLHKEKLAEYAKQLDDVVKLVEEKVGPAGK